MPQFDPHFLSSMIFWTTVSFLILLVILWKMALPGIMQVLEDRTNRIKGDLDSAETLKAEAARLKAETEAQLAKTRAEADEIIAKAQEKAGSLLADNEAKMKEEADKIIADAHRAIEQERGQAVGDLKKLAADLAIAAAGKFVATGLDEKAQLKLVEESLVELEARYGK